MTSINRANTAACAGALAVALGLLALLPAGADVIYQEYGGVVVGEGELYSSRTNAAAGDGWLVVPVENAGAGTNLNARGGAYVQSLPDNGTAGGPTNPPSISYKMQLFTPGTYRLYLRLGGNTLVGGGGNSDSLFVDIVELKDGFGVFGSATNKVADWYELASPVDGDFATTPWYSTAKPEVNEASASGYNAEWTITREGVYTLRISEREDGAAVDAWVFQLATLPAPTGYGPAMSAVQPSRVFIPAAADTFLKRNEPTVPHGTNAEILVKNDLSATPGDLDRNTFLRFDLSALAGLTNNIMAVTNAELRIDLVAAGTSTNHEIYVAAIAEEAADETFAEDLLTPSTSDVWDSATDEAVNFNKVLGQAPLGSFDVSTGINGKTVTFSGPGLRHAIRADTDGVLALVLYRTFDNPGSDNFASKEHPTFGPPRLVLTIGPRQRGSIMMLQ